MKQNLLLVGYNYETTKRIAGKLSEFFSMRVLDQIELFEFDHIPYSFAQMCDKTGQDYVRKCFNSILKMELSFENVIFIADISFADNCSEMLSQINETNFVILLKKNIDEEIIELKSKSYESNSVKIFFDTDKELLHKRECLIEENCADVVTDISELSDDEITKKIISQIESFYSE